MSSQILSDTLVSHNEAMMLIFILYEEEGESIEFR